MYVSGINPAKNEVRISDRDGLSGNKVRINNLNWLEKVDFGSVYTAKIRYNTQPAECTIKETQNGLIEVDFKEPVFAVTPGQSCVIYKGDLVIGGGLITS
jgi:tRNA-specific 2-thiouridylase